MLAQRRSTDHQHPRGRFTIYQQARQPGLLLINSPLYDIPELLNIRVPSSIPILVISAKSSQGKNPLQHIKPPTLAKEYSHS